MSKIDLSGFTPPRAGIPAHTGQREPLGSVEPTPPGDMLSYLQQRYPDRISFSLEDVAVMLGVDYETVRRRVAEGHIASIQFGRRRLITIQELARILTTGVT